MNTLDLNKPLQTIEGEPVSLLVVNPRGGGYPVIGFIGDKLEYDTWTEEGDYINSKEDHEYDLMNVPEKPLVLYTALFKSSTDKQYHIGAIKKTKEEVFTYPKNSEFLQEFLGIAQITLINN